MLLLEALVRGRTGAQWVCPNPNPNPKPKPKPNQVRGRIGTEWGLRTGPLHSTQAGPTPEPYPYP